MPGWTIRSATLAKIGSLEAALAALNDPLIYPFFMAEGWFTGRELPRRLAAAGKPDLTRLRPFGSDPALVALIEEVVRDTWPPEHPNLLLAAHGSKISRTLPEAMRGNGTFSMAVAAVVGRAAMSWSTFMWVGGVERGWVWRPGKFSWPFPGVGGRN